ILRTGGRGGGAAATSGPGGDSAGDERGDHDGVRATFARSGAAEAGEPAAERAWALAHAGAGDRADGGWHDSAICRPEVRDGRRRWDGFDTARRTGGASRASSRRASRDRGQRLLRRDTVAGNQAVHDADRAHAANSWRIGDGDAASA